MNDLPDHPAAIAALPVAIRLRTASQMLEVDWEDGTTSAWTHGALRHACRCGGCEALRRAGHAVATAERVALLAVVPYGPGALRFTFSDGHALGIYPYAYLRQLTACEEPMSAG